MNNIITLSYSNPKENCGQYLGSDNEFPRGEFVITKNMAVKNGDGSIETSSETITDIQLVEEFRSAIAKRDELHREMQALKEPENTEGNRRLYLEKRAEYKEIKAQIEAMDQGLSAIMALAIKNDEPNEPQISEKWFGIMQSAFPAGLQPVF